MRDASLRYGGPIAGHNAVWEIPAIVVPAMLTFIALFALYLLVPTARPRARDAWIGAAVAAVMFEAVKNGFAFYVSHFNNFNVIYGSLAGVFLFLFSTFLASNVLLIGAEIPARWEMRDGAVRCRAGRALIPLRRGGAGAGMVKGLFVRQ